MWAQAPLRYTDYLRWQAAICLAVGVVHFVCGVPGVFVHQPDSAMLLAGPICVVFAGLAGVIRGGSPLRPGTWFAPRRLEGATGALGAARARQKMLLAAAIACLVDVWYIAANRAYGGIYLALGAAFVTFGLLTLLAWRAAVQNGDAQSIVVRRARFDLGAPVVAPSGPEITVDPSSGAWPRFVTDVGSMFALTVRTVVSAVKPPFSYGGEFTQQFLFVLRVSLLPLLVSMVAFGYAVPGLQGAGIDAIVGAIDRNVSVDVLVSIREFAPFLTAVVIAGVAGTAITADLGARRIREEIDALEVLGVDTTKNLVVPRFLALVVLTGLFDVFAVVAGVLGGLAVQVLYHSPLDTIGYSLFTSTMALELQASIVKSFGYGAIIAIVCCYKGLKASGGPAGVGRAVNEAVVISFLGVFSFNYVFTQVLLATHPELSIIR